MQARFSTVLHPRGSPEALRDVRGFTVRFQTEEGNWDLVGNNFPVFFVRDGLKFVDLVHALKPDPQTHEQVRLSACGSAIIFLLTCATLILDSRSCPSRFSASHPCIQTGSTYQCLRVIAPRAEVRARLQEWWRIFDFLSFHPESAHILTWLLDDVGIPKNYRHMDGFGVHTFVLTKGDKNTYVKFHWHTDQGVKNLTDDEAVTVRSLPCL